MTSQEFLTVAGWIAEGKAQVKSYEAVASGGWRNCNNVCLAGEFSEYRRKPEPREWWIQDGYLLSPCAYSSKQLKGPSGEAYPNQIHVREVIEP